MKKAILVISIILISLMLLAGCTPPPTNGQRDNLVTDMKSYYLLEDFITQHPDRTAGDSTSVDKVTGLNNCDRAGMWISQQFIDMGYTAADNGVVPFTYTNAFRNDRVEKAYNIIFTKDNPATDKRVVIASHYDNVTNFTVDGKVLGGEGAYNNAVGVVALLQTAKVLKDIDLPYDVVFAAFSAEEVDLAGSNNFVGNMKDVDIINTLLMVNYSSVTGGDYIYMYADEVNREHADLFVKTALDKKYNLTAAPNNMRSVMNAQLKGTNLMYYNNAMAGDNLPFNLKGINTLTYLSCNFDDRATQKVTELKGFDNVAYNNSDTLVTMLSRLGGEVVGKARIESDIDTVVLNTVAVMQNADFEGIMASSQKNKFDYSVIGNYNTMRIIGFAVLGVGLAIVLVLYFVIKANLKPHAVIIDTAMGRVDMSRGVIIPDNVSTTVAPAPKVDPFEEEFGGDASSNTPPSSNGEVSNTKKDAVDVDVKDIFSDF